MNRFVYKDERQGQISFPLGGIGSGCIGLAGNGRLIDWEIANRPNKGGLNGFTHFSVKAESKGKLLDARVLHGDLQPPLTGQGAIGHSGFGFGPARETLAGLPHFRNTVFEGRYPFASIDFSDPAFPGKPRLTAFNPFVPCNAKDSSIPAALFEIQVTNTTSKVIHYTVTGVLGGNMLGRTRNRFSSKSGISQVQLRSPASRFTEPGMGDLTIATDAADVSHQEYWFRGAWFDSLEVYWRDLTRPGRFSNRRYSKPGRADQALLAAHLKLRPGQTRSVRFVISWNFPVCENSWAREHAERLAKKARIPKYWRNYYATVWKDSRASASYALSSWEQLYGETKLFHDTLFSSSLPDVVLEAVSANMSILKTPTVLRLEDGTLYGFEGCRGDTGCCPGSCTHVWNYAQAQAFLFPELARGMRSVDYKYNQQKDGGMPFRMTIPLGIRHPGGFSCADGLFGNVMLVYRDWKLSGDTDWLRSLWPAVKKSISFAWAKSNSHQWDPEKTGTLWGRQHHTLDMELYGPSSWLCGFYLGALKAAAYMAEHLNDDRAAEEYAALFAKGSAWLENHLFNGEYYQQLVDITDKRVLTRFDAVESYWDSEHREIKYQIDEGCAIDQTLAQYHAGVYGLGDIFDRKRNRKALKSLYKYNFKTTMRATYNPCRLYSMDDEGGMAICSWPEHKRKPAIPLTYAQETMHGFEYAAAVQLIHNGMLKEGLAVVKSIRDRYDGRKRNPWNEFECGSNYARSMASYALLTALSGFEFDMTRSHIGFRPLTRQSQRFSCFWSVDSAWGQVQISEGETKLIVLHGRLPLKSLALAGLKGCRKVKTALGGKTVAAGLEDDVLYFRNKIVITKKQMLKITLK